MLVGGFVFASYALVSCVRAASTKVDRSYLDSLTGHPLFTSLSRGGSLPACFLKNGIAYLRRIRSSNTLKLDLFPRPGFDRNLKFQGTCLAGTYGYLNEPCCRV